MYISDVEMKHISMSCSGWEDGIFEMPPQDVTDLVIIVECPLDIARKLIQRVNV